MRNTTEIKIEEKICKDKDHRPTEEAMKSEDLKPGRYQHVCPTCGKKVIWNKE